MILADLVENKDIKKDRYYRTCIDRLEKEGMLTREDKSSYYVNSWNLTPDGKRNAETFAYARKMDERKKNVRLGQIMQQIVDQIETKGSVSQIYIAQVYGEEGKKTKAKATKACRLLEYLGYKPDGAFYLK